MLFFKEDQFISLKRAELFGITDFIANVGGLLGLFMGVSLLSIVEIFYFCTIRWIYRLKGQRGGSRGSMLNGTVEAPTPTTVATDNNHTRNHLRRY